LASYQYIYVVMARPRRFELLTPRSVVFYAAILKSRRKRTQYARPTYNHKIRIDIFSNVARFWRVHRDDVERS